jgi:hypothetical protein
MTNTPDMIVTLHFEGFLDVPVSGAEIEDERLYGGAPDIDTAAFQVASSIADLEIHLDRKAGITVDLAEVDDAIRGAW